MKKETIKTTWEIWTYDVWGNARDGYDVNDRYCRNRNYRLKLEVKEYNNTGKPGTFKAAFPTDKQIRQAFGLNKTRLDISGDDLSIYINRASDSYPIGEMICTSHDSLSPIREIANK